ncbi:hypothetical protein ACFYYR_04295 [Streptomyces sp. NPDC001922]|uniref:hypothetical protein n=1 Tax=Streptomyces sp. NPDC001922 TaxID=3364624 RepID=UPI003688FB49
MTNIPAPFRIGEPETRFDAAAGSLSGSDEFVDRLSRYLGSARGLILAPGTVQSPFSDSEKVRVRVGMMTDGVWVWHVAWSDYVAYHRVAPPAEFLRHIESVDFTVPDMSVDRAVEICEEIGLPMPD